MFSLSLISVAQTSQESVANPALLEQEKALVKIIEGIGSTEDPLERNKLNQKLLIEMDHLMTMEGVFEYDFPEIKGISMLTTPSRSLKMTTWELENEQGEMKYYGFVALKRKKSESIVYRLQDSSDVIRNAENAYLFSDKWYGAVYYDVREIKMKGDLYYVLLGINRRHELTKERIIEVLTNSGDPIFGKEIFNFSQRVMMKRLIYPHASNTDMTISFQEDGLIVMDHLSPSNPVYEGKFEYYVPDLSFDALRLKKGIWNYEPDYDARMVKNLKDRFYEMELPKQEKMY